MKTKLVTLIFLITFFNFSFSQEEVIEIQEVDTTEDEDYEDVPFAIIEEVPIYPGCEGNNQQKKSCMNLQIKKHVAENFNSSLIDSLGLSPGKKRIYAMFKISKTGNVIGVKIRAPHETLKKEVHRVVKLLPKMIPGKQRGKPINVKYMLPIIFKVANYKSASKQVSEDHKTDDELTNNLIERNQLSGNENFQETQFAIIEDPPIFPGCKGLTSETKKCFHNSIIRHIKRKFNLSVIRKLSFKGTIIIYAHFKITKEGNVKIISVRAPHKNLQNEAIRVLNRLPKMTPGMQDGKPVEVSYMLPISLSER